jgi:hypothetical protein
MRSIDHLRRTWGTVYFAMILATGQLTFAIPTIEYATQVSATIQSSPPVIVLGWPPNSEAVNFKVYRKLITETSWGNPIATLDTSATGYTDTNVIVGSSFEYQVEVLTDIYPYPNGSPSDWFTSWGYCYAGIDVPMIENRGKIILIVDNTFSSALANELFRLQQDLVGDGWAVLRHDVGRSDSVTSVKALIQTDYNSDPANVRSVFLIGHVPVPYSGAINPDGHSDHYGAWAADVYYAELDGPWTDNSVAVTSAERAGNYNVPGDGKFDQSTIPSDVDLEIGRVDLSNLPAFAPKTELDLLRQYLNKDHSFRTGSINLQRRGLIRDNFGELEGEAPASTAWRNFAGLCGSNTTVEIESGLFFSTLDSEDYLWAYGCGGGFYNKADGVGYTTNFVASDTRSVFMMLFGSYFGDWDAQDDFLRAPLATPTYTLTCAWGGFPVWMFHHMALGQTIGYSTRISQNNSANGPYRTRLNPSPRSVHIALMGDPALRLHAVVPPSGLINTTPGGATLIWTASPDTVVGYYVYRSTSIAGPFTRVNSAPITGTAFNDNFAQPGLYTYMVRAVKRETSGSGTYFNLSQGIILSVNVSQPAPCSPGSLGLVDWWPGDGNSQDIQGTNNATLVGGVGYIAGKVSTGFFFDGTNDEMDVGAKFASVTNNFTIAFWANPNRNRTSGSETNLGFDGLSGQHYAIYPTQGSASYGSGHAGWGISLGTNGASVFEYSDNHFSPLLVFDAPILGWTHIAVTCSNKVPRLYLNGIWKHTGLMSTFKVHPAANVGGSAGRFGGGLDELMIFNRALKGAEIQTMVNAGSGGLCKQIQITGLETFPNGTQITIQGRTGRIGIETGTNFLYWTEIGLVTNTTGNATFLDPAATTQPRRFYRAQLK